jgi:hypothetical protein
MGIGPLVARLVWRGSVAIDQIGVGQMKFTVRNSTDQYLTTNLTDRMVKVVRWTDNFSEANVYDAEITADMVRLACLQYDGGAYVDYIGN